MSENADLKTILDRLSDLEQSVVSLSAALDKLQNAWGVDRARLTNEVQQVMAELHTVKHQLAVSRKELHGVQAAQRLSLKMPLPPAVVPLRKRSKYAIGLAAGATGLALLFAVVPHTVSGDGWSYSSEGLPAETIVAICGALGGLGWFGFERVRDEKKHRDSTGGKGG